MKTWKVAHRMYLLVGIATIVMLGLAGMNWLSMSCLATLQDASHQLAKQAGQMARYAGLGADTYRVIADTALNRQFDDAARRWHAMTGEVDAALASAAAMATTDPDRQALQRAATTMQQIRQLYTAQYLPLAQSGRAGAGHHAQPDRSIGPGTGRGHGRGPAHRRWRPVGPTPAPHAGPARPGRRPGHDGGQPGAHRA
jgi:hypothetical protein